jgi:hypothetical protein
MIRKKRLGRNNHGEAVLTIEFAAIGRGPHKGDAA